MLSVFSAGAPARFGNDGTQPLQTETSGVGAVVGVTATVGAIGVPITLADAGVLGTFAQAADNGSSIAASGLANASGDIGVALVDPSGVPSALSLDLANILSTGFAAELTRLQLDVGAASSRASMAARAVRS